MNPLNTYNDNNNLIMSDSHSLPIKVDFFPAVRRGTETCFMDVLFNI